MAVVGGLCRRLTARLRALCSWSVCRATEALTESDQIPQLESESDVQWTDPGQWNYVAEIAYLNTLLPKFEDLADFARKNEWMGVDYWNLLSWTGHIPRYPQVGGLLETLISDESKSHQGLTETHLNFLASGKPHFNDIQLTKTWREKQLLRTALHQSEMHQMPSKPPAKDLNQTDKTQQRYKHQFNSDFKKEKS